MSNENLQSELLGDQDMTHYTHLQEFKFSLIGGCGLMTEYTTEVGVHSLNPQSTLSSLYSPKKEYSETAK